MNPEIEFPVPLLLTLLGIANILIKDIKIKRFCHDCERQGKWGISHTGGSQRSLESDRERVFIEHSADLRLAYEFCNELTDIFNEALVKSRGRRKLESWIKRVRQSGLKCFNTFLDTLTQRMDEITNYFRNRHTSGFVEGLNNKIKVIKRRCYGLFNVGHLFQRIYLDLKGYELFASQRG